jgi:hypothetical protein
MQSRVMRRLIGHHIFFQTEGTTTCFVLVINHHKGDISLQYRITEFIPLTCDAAHTMKIDLTG